MTEKSKHNSDLVVPVHMLMSFLTSTTKIQASHFFLLELSITYIKGTRRKQKNNCSHKRQKESSAYFHSEQGFCLFLFISMNDILLKKKYELSFCFQTFWTDLSSKGRGGKDRQTNKQIYVHNWESTNHFKLEYNATLIFFFKWCKK